MWDRVLRTYVGVVPAAQVEASLGKYATMGHPGIQAIDSWGWRDPVQHAVDRCTLRN
jgi:hypothetical protein